MRHTISVDERLLDYVTRVGVREHPALAACRTETLDLGGRAVMQISPEQGAFMSILIKILSAKNTLEVGVFTGYSALCTALALPDDGRMIACDVSEEWTDRAKTYWRQAEMDHKIDLRIAPATETLDILIAEGRAGAFDFAFIDADKTSYDAYYEKCLTLVRPGGLIAIDNMLWNGAVIKPDDKSDDTVAIRTLNEKIRDDQRVDICLAAIGDGIMLATKR
jgi:predicted O-methyltransferase YrrM